MSITLRVRPDILKNKAAEIETDIKALENEFNNIQDIITRTTGYWQGIAGDKARTRFHSQKDDIQKVLIRFKEYPADLLEMAGVYEQTEHILISDHGVLKTDVII